MHRTMVYVDYKTWKKFRLICLSKKITYKSVITGLIMQYVEGSIVPKEVIEEIIEMPVIKKRYLELKKEEKKVDDIMFYF